MAERSADVLLNVILNETNLNTAVSGLDRLGAATDQVNAKSAAMAAQMAAAAEQELAAANQMSEASRQLQEAMDQLNARTAAEQDAVASLSDEYTNYASQAEIDAEIKKAESQATWDYVAALQAEKDAHDQLLSQSEESAAAYFDQGGDGGAGGAGVGSLYGVARGARAGAGIGRIFGAGPETTLALTGAADILYLEQAFTKLSDVLPALNKAAETSGGLVQSLATDIAAFGIPMSGLLSSVILVTPAVAALAGAIVVLKSQLDEGKTSIEAGIAQVDAYYKLLEEGKTTSQITDDLAKKNEALAEAEKHLDQVRGAQIQSINDAITAGGQLGAVAGVAKVAASGAMADLKKDSEDTQKAIKELTAARDADKAALDSGVLATNDAAEAEKKLAEVRQRTIENDINWHAQYTKLAESGTSDQLNQARQNLLDQQARDEYAIQKYLGPKGASRGVRQISPEDQAQLEKYREDLDQVNQHLKDLDGISAQVNERTRETEAAKKAEADAIREANNENSKLETAVKAVATAQDNYNQKILDTEQKLQQNIDLSRQKEVAAEQPYTLGSFEDVNKRADIVQSTQRKIADEETATSQRIEDIHTKTGQNILKIETDYNRQLFDDQVKNQENFQKLITDNNNTLEIDALDHAEKLADIQKQSNQNELDDIANRDFQKLAKDLQGRQTSIDKENESYQDQQTKQALHLKQQEDALAVSLANQEAQQKTAEERKIADAETTSDNEIAQVNTTEDRKISALKSSEQQQLDDLTRNEQRKIEELRIANIREITMMQQRAITEENLAAQTTQRIINQANQIINAGSNAFIDDLNRLNAAAAGQGTLPTPSTYNPTGATYAPGAGLQGAGSYGASTPAAQTPVDVGAIVNGIYQTVVGGLLQGFGL